jgi:hypothetical protein
MKALVINGIVYGAFKSIEELDDRYLCDNVEMQFSVVGKGEIVDADTVELPVIQQEKPKTESISMRQARLELLNRNLLDDVNVALSSLSQAAQIEWEYATEVRREHPLVAQLSVLLNMSESDMDSFFDAAKLL